MGQDIELFDVEQFFSENACRRNRASLAVRLADWIQDYGDRAPWDRDEDGDYQNGSPQSFAASENRNTTGANDAKAKKSRKKKQQGARLTQSADDAGHDGNSPVNQPSYDGQQDIGITSSLYRLLDRSGTAIADRREDLRDGGRAVLIAINERNDSDVTAAANAVRIWIGAFWFLVAGWLYVQYTNAKIAGAAATASGIPVGEATVMASIFALLGLLAAIAGIGALLIGSARRAFSNEQFIKASTTYGGWIASTLMDFDTRLQNHRRRLGDKTLQNEEVLREVSEAHITAEEAAILFNEVGFLVEGGDDTKGSALAAFRDYLNGCGLVSPSAAKSGILAGGILGLFGGIFLGAVLGALILLEVMSISPGQFLDKIGLPALSGFDKYPRALLAIIVPSSLLVVAGGIGELLATALLARERNRRLRDSLQAVRSAITAAQAPRARDIAQRVEDLSEIFRVRLAKTAGANGAFSEPTEPAPSWRQRDAAQDEGPRFVNTGFTAAPKPFLADIHAPQNAKKFAPVRETKRGLFGLGKPRAR